MLTQKQMIKIFEDKTSDKLNKKEYKQFMNFMFGEEFMESDDKGTLKQYIN